MVLHLHKLRRGDIETEGDWLTPVEGMRKHKVSKEDFSKMCAKWISKKKALETSIKKEQAPSE